MTEAEETAYVQGSRFAWTMMLIECLSNLAYKGTEAEAVDWIAERERAIHSLRSICAKHGDNDWPDDLDLSDIINKHLDL